MYLKIKRAMDLTIVLVLIPLWIPLMLVLVILVKTTSRGPIFFRQKRVKRNRCFFMIYKFRSMYVTAPKDVPTHQLENPSVFITPLGRFLRKSSLDELPQVINVIRGDISLVGPRPALWNQYDLIAEREKYGANNIPVGLTGLAQVKGRDDLSIQEKAVYDGEYVKKMNIWLDISILFSTVINVVRGRGIKQ